MDKVLAFLGNNKRTGTLGLAVVALLVAFGFDSSRVEAIVLAFAGLAAALFASDGDTKSAIDRELDSAADPKID